VPDITTIPIIKKTLPQAAQWFHVPLQTAVPHRPPTYS